MADKEAAREELSKFKKRINKIFNMKDTKARSAAVLEVLEEYRSGQLDYLFQDNTHAKEFVKSVMKELHITPSAIHSTSKTSDDIKNKVTDPKFRTSIVDNLMKALLNATNVPGDRNLSNVELVVNGIAGAVINGDSAGLQKTVEDFINNPDNNVKQMKAFQKELANISPMIKNISEALSLALDTATQTLQNKIESGFYRQGPIAERVSQVTGRVKDTFKRVFYKADPVQETETPCTALVPVDMKATPEEIVEINKEEAETEAESTALVPAGTQELSTDVKVPIDLEALFGDENGKPVKKGGFKKFFENVRAYISGKYAQFLEFLDNSVDRLKEWFANRKKEQEDPTFTEETGLEVIEFIGAAKFFDKDKNELSTVSIPAGMDIRNKEHWGAMKEGLDPEGTLFKKGNFIFVTDGHTMYQLDPESLELTDLSKNMGRQESGQALLTDGKEQQFLEAEFEVIDENNNKTKFKLSEFLDKLGEKFKKVWEKLKEKWENRKTRNKDKEKEAEIDEDHLLPPGKEEGEEHQQDEDTDELEGEENDGKPRRSLKDRLSDLRKGAKEGFSKLGERFKKRTKEERVSFQSKDYLDAITTYLERVDKTRLEGFKDVASFISGANFEEKKNNNLKNALINVKSVIDAYIERVEQAKVPYGFYPPAEGLIAAIELECQKTQVNDATKVDTLVNEDVTKGQNNIVANVTAIRDQIESYSIDPDTKKKVKFLFEESLRTAGYDESNPEETAKRFKKWFGIKPDMSMDDMLTKIQEFGSSPRAFAKDKKAQDVYRDPIKAFKDFYAQTAPGRQRANDVKMISEADFVAKYARSIALGIIHDELSASVDSREEVINGAAGKTYRSIKMNNRKLLKNIAENTRAIAARCNTEAATIMSEFQNGLVQGHEGIVITNESGEVTIDTSKLSKELLEQVKEEVKKIIDEVSLLPDAQKAMEDKFTEMGQEKGQEQEPVEINPAELSNDAMNGFAEFIEKDQDRVKTASEFTDAYITGIAQGFSLHNLANNPTFKPLVTIFADKKATIDQKIAAIKTDKELETTLRELVAEGQDFEAFLKEFVTSGHNYYTATPDMETVVADYEKETNTKVGDKETFAKKFSCVQQIAEVAKEVEKDPSLQTLLNQLYEEYYSILQNQKAQGIELTEQESKFMSQFEKSKFIAPSNTNDSNDYTYDLTNFESDYDKWKETADRLAKGEKLDPDVKKHDALVKAHNEVAAHYVPEIVKKLQTLGSTGSGEYLTDKERAFLGANAALITKCNDKLSHNDLCKGVLAHTDAGKVIPNVTANKEEVKDANGKVLEEKYTLSIQNQKSYEEIFPSTDITSKIAKTVKDLKDAYVYLKPGIKLCDKLIDYIKGLKFTSETSFEAPEGGDTGNNGGNGNNGNGQTDPAPTNDDNAKILALLQEINNRLADLEKAIKLASNGVDSAKLDAMKKDGDIYTKLIEAFALINKEGQDPKFKEEHNPAYMTCQNNYNALHMQLMGMGQMQIPAHPMGNGMYAISGDMLAFMASMNNQMFGAPFASFSGLDPAMYSKMYAQMRPSFTASISVVSTQGVKIDLKVKLAAGLVNESQVNLFKKDIHDHIYNFVETSSTDINAIKGDLTTYLEEILPGSTIESTSLVNVKTGEKTELGRDGVEGQVNAQKPQVKPAGTKENEAPAQRFDCTLNNGILTVTDKGKPVASEPVKEGQFNEKQIESFRKQLASIDESQLKTPDDVRRAIDGALATMGLGEREIGE